MYRTLIMLTKTTGVIKPLKAQSSIQIFFYQQFRFKRHFFNDFNDCLNNKKND